ncbi:hypothetical protein H5410_003882 [Solanum commersonii]|uniref:Uncharacterized protein n=1 Tax=Solanum commersonii TaxID=4109 RepID=A0A9J6B5W4_SOLCO|nr:hypothetical protein H5410_003882 [Solanum commersonii]
MILSYNFQRVFIVFKNLCCSGSFGAVSFIAVLLYPSALSCFGSLGDIVLLHRIARLSTLEQKTRIRPFGDSPNGFGDSHIFISSFFQLPLFLFAK